jgi:hypothetical protein
MGNYSSQSVSEWLSKVFVIRAQQNRLFKKCRKTRLTTLSVVL